MFTICHSCSVVFSNSDDSHIEEDLLATVEAFVESVGLVSLVGEVDNGGYWNCPCCGEIQIGSGVMWDTISN